MPLFSGLQISARKFLQTCLCCVEFAEGERIIQRGMRGGFMAIVGRGQVELKGASGFRQTIREGQAFGEAMLRFGVPSSFTATATTSTTLWVVKRIDWVFASELSFGLGGPPSPRKPNRTTHRLRSWSITMMTTLIVAILILYPEELTFAHQKFTRFALDAGRPELAEAYLRFASNLQPNYAGLYDALGYSLYLQGEEAEALTAFERAVTIDQRLASARNNLGVALLEQSQASLAIEQLQASVELDPENPAALLNLGNAFLAAGDHQSAAEAYQRVIEMAPDQVEARALLAAIELEEGRLMEAYHLWMQALDIDPGYPLALQGLGVIAVLQGKPGQALVDLKAAAAANPNDATTRVYLGLALESLGRPLEAASEFEKALSLDDDPVMYSLAYSHLMAIRSNEEATEQPGKER
ncbi:MAG: tetratricopeptide repeat protein [Anaerolineales bacterium]|nr:tetratricopeptide repeat protein [Anaerolineales bacterium]